MWTGGPRTEGTEFHGGEMADGHMANGKGSGREIAEISKSAFSSI